VTNFSFLLMWSFFFLTFVEGILVAILYQLAVDQQWSVQLMPYVCACVGGTASTTDVGSFCGDAAPMQRASSSKSSCCCQLPSHVRWGTVRP